MKLVLLFVLIQQACECEGAIFVQFNITQGEPSTEGIRCVLKSLDASYTGFAIRDENGECVILSQGWVTNKAYYPGYTYLEKGIEMDQNSNGVAPIFQSFVYPDDEIGEPSGTEPGRERVWTFPGVFGVGARLQLYFSPGQSEYQTLRFQLFNHTTASASDAADDLSGVIGISIFVGRGGDVVKFKSYSGRWTTAAPTLNALHFEDDHTYGMSIVAQQASFQILFDGIERAIIPHVGPPAVMMKKMVMQYRPDYSVFINNITFYGI